MNAFKILGSVGLAAALLATGAQTAHAATTVAPCWVLDDSIYQAVNPTTQSSLLTRSASEATGAASSGFSDYRGMTFVASGSNEAGLVGVHRLFKRTTGDFMFTSNDSEVSSAVASYGYSDDGVKFYASPVAGNCTAPVVRYVKGSMHRLSNDPTEQAALTAAGWKSEGTKFYAAPVPTTDGGDSGLGGSSNTTGLNSGSVTSSGVKPTAATTGVPAGTPLVQYTGNITITREGTVLDGMDIHGFVNVKAKNVTIRNSIVRGGVATAATGVITDYGYTGLLISDVTVQPEFPSVYTDGIKGNNFTAVRVHVNGGVDTMKVHGDNVHVVDTLLENTQYFANDPAQNGGGTHNDNIQILYGNNITIEGTAVRGATGFGILGAADVADTNLVVKNNWLDGGWCSMKLQALNGHTETATTTDNKFGPNHGAKNCAFQALPGVNLTDSGSVWEADGTPVTIIRTP